MHFIKFFSSNTLYIANAFKRNKIIWIWRTMPVLTLPESAWICSSNIMFTLSRGQQYPRTWHPLNTTGISSVTGYITPPASSEHARSADSSCSCRVGRHISGTHPEINWLYARSCNSLYLCTRLKNEILTNKILLKNAYLPLMFVFWKFQITPPFWIMHSLLKRLALVSEWS